LREWVDKWDYIKLKGFWRVKQIVTELTQPMDWEKMFASYASDKRLITRIRRKLKKLNSQRIIDPRNK
jgi:hypothetical protein